jgi:hypothetical protein
MSPAIPTPLFYTITPAITRNGTKESVSLDHQDLGSYFASLYTQQGKGMLRLPAFVGRTARVEEQKTIFILQKGDVRVSKDDHAGFGEATRQTPAAALSTPRVVDHSYFSAAEAELQRLGKVHLRRVYVAPDGADGSVERQLVEQRRVQQISCVQDEIRLFEVREHSFRQALRAPGYVRVGEDDG